MWKEVYETKVIRVEGMEQENLITQIFLTNSFVDQLAPYNLDKAFELPMKTTCRIIPSSIRSLARAAPFRSPEL